MQNCSVKPFCGFVEISFSIARAAMLLPEEKAKLSLGTLLQLRQILTAASCPSFPDGVLFALIPFVVLAYMMSGYYLILAPGNLYNALVSEDWKSFRTGLSNYALWATAVMAIKVLRGALRESTANYVRKRVTQVLHDLYFGTSDRESEYGAAPYYRVALKQKVDNPDQRIVADARQFSNSFLSILAGGSEGADSGGVFEALASILFYTYKTMLRTGWYGVLVAYLWSLLVAVISVAVINRTSPVVFKQERLEADFRFAHTELRRNAEEVAFLRGAPFERRKLTDLFHRALSNTWIVIYRHFFLNIVRHGFSYYVSIIMYLAIALAVHTNVFAKSGASFSAALTPGEKAQWISQTGGIFIQLLYSFTMVIQLGTAVTELVTNTNRVSSLIDDLRDESGFCRGHDFDEDSIPLIPGRDTVASTDTVQCDVSEGISADNLCLQPNAGTTIGPVSFSLKKGEWLLIDGPSGSGKTSLLRALRGLWKPVSGTIRIPTGPNEVVFVPQVSYISAGVYSLRELVKYPRRCTGSEEETASVEAALRSVGWNNNDVRLQIDIREDWSARLSPGEAQLVAVARLLECKPAYAVLDEPTSSLDRESERRVFAALKASGVEDFTRLMVEADTNRISKLGKRCRVITSGLPLGDSCT